MPVPCPFCNCPSDLPLEYKEARSSLGPTEQGLFDFLWRRSPGYVSHIEMMERMEAIKGSANRNSLKTMIHRVRRKMPEHTRIEPRFTKKGGYRLVSDKYNRSKMFT